MKTAIYMRFITILVVLSLALMASPLMAQVYKTVDKDGNVTFTDQPPADGSKPIKLAPISVIEAPAYEKAPPADVGAEKEMSLADVRRSFRDFAIVSPQSEESVWKPDGPIAIAWSAGSALQEGMQVEIYLDGRMHTATTQQMVPVVGMDRGEHSVYAVLKDSKKRVIATTEPVVFFVRQPGLGNRARNARG
ncbi:MAG: DUF4124 domain-containing protein [Xanthomonadales bacterium]|nr:DUF4124 domain-containing protein [Xanthomonadales bacterium]